MRTLIFLLIIGLTPLLLCSQIYIEPAAGYQFDVNNDHSRHFNSELRFSFKKGKLYEFMLKVQKSWPVSSGYVDSSFSVNPNLPLYSPANKTIHTSSFSIAAGNRFKVLGMRSKNSLFVTIFTGVAFQQFDVSYKYDKANYTILNPDQTAKEGGLFVTGGLGYMRQLKNSRFIFEINIASPPAAKINYPSSFNLMSPLSFNIGYSIRIKK